MIKIKCRLTERSLFLGSARNLPMNSSPEPPLPPPRNHDQSSSFNESKDSNEISEAECDRDQLVNRNYGGTYRSMLHVQTDHCKGTSVGSTGFWDFVEFNRNNFKNQYR